jgi:hypothetical protein
MLPTMKRKEASDDGGAASVQEAPELKKAKSALFVSVAAVFVGKQANIQFSIQKQNFVKQGGLVVAESAAASATHIIYHAASSATAAALQIRGISNGLFPTTYDFLSRHVLNARMCELVHARVCMQATTCSFPSCRRSGYPSA